jgi:hypothetical protein
MKKPGQWLNELTLGKKTLLGFGVVILSIATIAGASPGQTNTTPSNPKPSTGQGKPEVTTKTETESIPFTSTTVNDGALAKGATKVTTAGVNGSQTLTYKVTYKNGKQTDKKLVSTTITSPPVAQVTSIGTYVAPPPPPAPKCDPNYSGACVPIASDVDCAGGSGNGPAYVSGPVYVVGTDIYGLDRDGDGVGCE